MRYEVLKPGEARVEFLACWETIEGMLKKGHTVASIYEYLHRRGLIKMSRRTLQEKVNSVGKFSVHPRVAGPETDFEAAAQPAKDCRPLPAAAREPFKDLDETLAQAAAQREKAPKRNVNGGQEYSRKKLIGNFRKCYLLILHE